MHDLRELCSYAGLTPKIRQSGTSINGRARISKIGNQKLRNLLFMCSFNACKYNKACKAIYDRIVAKGKSKKLALIAVCNKLLKQAFAIAKSGLIYDDGYRSVLVRNEVKFACFLPQFFVVQRFYFHRCSFSFNHLSANSGGRINFTKSEKLSLIICPFFINSDAFFPQS